MLDLKCVHCPERGIDSGRCLKYMNKSGTPFKSCEEAKLDCEFKYSDGAAVQTDDLEKEHTYAC